MIHRNWKFAVPLGLVLGVILFNHFANESADFIAADAALGKRITSTVAYDDGLRISGHFEQLPEIRDTILELKKKGRKVVLMLGMSQLHAICNKEQNDNLAVFYANQRAADRGAGISYVQVSDGNANLHEFLGTYLYLRESGIVPDWLVIAVTYNNLRDPGYRPSLIRRLKELPPFPTTVLQAGGEGVKDIVEEMAKHQQHKEAEAAPVERSSIEATPQEFLEKILLGWIEKIWPAYRYRDNLWASLVFDGKTFVASMIFRVIGRPVVLVPPGMQEWHKRALNSIIQLAKNDRVKLFLYKPSHRPGEKKFYHDRRKYDAFFGDLRERCSRESVYFSDFETIVPAEHWGFTRLGQPDVFHFDDSGHRLLGAAIDTFIGEKGD